MKRLLPILFLLLTGILTACDKFHTSGNGKLDGYWQLTNVDSLPAEQKADVRELMVFWAVQTDLLEMRDFRAGHANVIFHFEHKGNQLRLYDPIVNDRPISDSIVKDVGTIGYYGLSHLAETLQVLRLTGSEMTLQSERLRMYFRKY